jgi:two-component system OmpR family sensor kinase
MSSLVEDLLTITRLDEGRPLDRRRVDLTELATKAVADARVVDPSRPVTLDAPGPVLVEGDPNRLMQVLVNLLSNARVHTPAGTPVAVHISSDGTNAVVEVEDHGPGLTPTQATQVFDRFYRADPSRSRTQGGSGLGLAIVDAVVRAHGGTPSVHDTPGGGATFRVELPIQPAEAASFDPPGTAFPPPGTNGALPASKDHASS